MWLEPTMFVPCRDSPGWFRFRTQCGLRLRRCRTDSEKGTQNPDEGFAHFSHRAVYVLSLHVFSTPIQIFSSTMLVLRVQGYRRDGWHVAGNQWMKRVSPCFRCQLSPTWCQRRCDPHVRLGAHKVTQATQFRRVPKQIEIGILEGIL